MATQYRFKHLRSSVQGKAPQSEQIEKGEIAINFYDGEEFLTIKNSGDKIVKFRPEEFTQNAINGNLLDGTNQGVKNWKFANGSSSSDSQTLASFVDEIECVEGVQLTYAEDAPKYYGWEIFHYAFDYTRIRENVDYTISFDFQCDGNIGLNVLIINDAYDLATQLTTSAATQTYVTKNEWQHFDIVLKGIKNGSDESLNELASNKKPVIYIAVRSGNTNSEATEFVWTNAKIKNLQLVVGKAPMKWKESFKDSIEKAGVSADIIALSGQVNTLSGDVSDVKTTANNNGTAIEAINEWQGLRESEITNLHDAARKLESNVQILSGDVSELQSEVSGLTDDLGKVSGKVDDNTSAIDKLESDLTKTNKSIDTLTTEVENTEKVIAGAFEKVSESCGLNEGLQYQASATSNYVSAANSLAKAIEILDSELKKVSDNSNSVPDDVATKTDLNAVIESTVSKTDFNAFTGTTATKNELNALSGATVAKTEFDDYKVQLDEAFLVLTQTLHKFKEVYGLNEELTFKPATNTQYISNATSVADALNKLDLALQQITNTSNE